MNSFFKELFHYNDHFNRALIAALVANRRKVSGKCIDLLSHILNAHEIWITRIERGDVLVEPWKVHELQDLDAINKRNHERSGLIAETRELKSQIEWRTKDGRVFTNSIQDILFQCINHSTYHRAQIATEFRQSGIEPLLTDYIHYKMSNKN